MFIKTIFCVDLYRLILLLAIPIALGRYSIRQLPRAVPDIDR